MPWQTMIHPADQRLQNGQDTTHGTGDAEITSLTVLRGLAALWVVMLHLSPVLYIHEVLPEAAIVKAFVTSGGYAVPLFFILSGYVLGLRYMRELASPSRRSLVRFFWLRLGRIYPLHLVTLLAVLVMVARRGWPSDDEHTAAQFLANCFLVQAWGYDFTLSWNHVAWSISSEWFAYLLFPVMALFMARMGRRTAAVLLLAAVALSAALCAELFQGHRVPFQGVVVVVPTFAGGCLLSIVFPPSTLRSAWLVPEAAMAACVALPFVIGTGPELSAAYLVIFFFTVGVLAANGHFSTKFWRWRPLVYLGDISYSLYMTHVLTITVLMPLLMGTNLIEASVWVRLAAVVACLVAILGVSAFTYHCVERPSRRWSRRITTASAPGARLA